MKIQKNFNRKEKMFTLWINSSFFSTNGVILIEKNMLDKACKVFLNILLFLKNFDFIKNN